MSDPYQPPSTPLVSAKTGPELPEGWVPCPGCGGTDIKSPSFTWWGGAFGHKLLSHVVCQDCRRAFHAKTGKSTTPMIVAYNVVGLVIGIGAYLALRSL